MNKWSYSNEKKQISELIPPEIIDGYSVERIMLTTFSLQMERLTQILYELNALELVGDDKVRVFYDAMSRSGGYAENSILSEKYMYGVRLKRENALYAFHPKVILLRYIKKSAVNGSEDQARYVIVILSKNITDGNSLEVYSIAYGDVNKVLRDEIDKKNDMLEEANGKQVVDFLNNIINEAGINENNFFEDIINELSHVSFSQHIGSAGKERAVKFYTASEVWNEIQDRNDLIVVSPFLSNDFILKLKNTPLIVSSEQGFGKLSIENEKLKSIVENGGAFCSGPQVLHAKIYCWKDEDNNCTRYIIGSSNATNNGCNINKKSCNIEYNMGIVGGVEEYNDIKSVLTQSPFRNVTLDDCKRWSDSEEKDKFLARMYFDEFCEQISIKCEKNINDNMYQCTIAMKASAEKISKNKCSVEVGHPESGYVSWENREITLKARRPFSTIVVKIIDVNTADGNPVKREYPFSYSVYDEWDGEYMEELDVSCKDAYIDLLEHLQEQILKGKRVKGLSFRTRDGKSGDNLARNYSVNKRFIYENILTLAQQSKNEADLMKALQEIGKLTNMVLHYRKDDERQKTMKKMIDNLMKNAEERGNNSEYNRFSGGKCSTNI